MDLLHCLCWDCCMLERYDTQLWQGNVPGMSLVAVFGLRMRSPPELQKYRMKTHGT